MADTTKTFDFIVVGAGPAGCALAAQLAQAASRPSVLLVEAGGDNSDPLLRIDHNKYVQNMTPSQAWGYKSQPNHVLSGREIGLARGKGLGGSSAVNFTAWTEGSSDDMDRIAEYAHDNAWSWSRCKARWNSITNYHCKYPDIPSGGDAYVNLDPGTYGTNGPLHIGWPAQWDHYVTDMPEIWKQNGFPLNLNTNSGNPLGISVVPLTSWRGTRTTSADLLASAPENLTILTDTLIHRVLFTDAEDGTKRATGVLTVDGRVLQAEKEVIVSAGSLDSPKILMHSGIGPADQLAKFGIQLTYENSNVGKNFKDHYHVMMKYQRAEHTSTLPALFKSKANQKAALREWTLFRTGPFANMGCAMAVGWLKNDGVLKSAEYAALPADEREHLARPTVPSYEIAFNATPPEYYISPDTTPALASIILFVHNSQCSGELKLQSADPTVPLTFDVDYLNHDYDKRVAIEATRETMRVTRSEQFLKENVAFVEEPKSDSDEDILKFWQDNATSTWHMSSTCRLGKTQKEDCAVVDTSFSVFGVRGLRVVDLSVMPFLPTTHTQSFAYQVGLIAAEKMVEQYNL